MTICDRPHISSRIHAAAKRSLRVAAIVLSISALLSIHSHGQISTASLSGTVSDEAGSMIAGATISVVDPGTGFKRTTVSNQEGRFFFSALPIGRYLLRTSSSGFATVELPDVVLNASDQKVIGIRLRVGEVSETVVVGKEDTSVHSGSPSLSTAIGRRFVETIPVNGRSFISLIALSPGVTPTKSDSTNQGQFSVNGQRADSNNFSVDGVSANIGTNGSYTLGGTVPATNAVGSGGGLVSMEAIEELNIQTSNYAPEFGRFSGGQIAVVTRAGTNRFNGSLFEYFRNDALDANDWFANRDGFEKPPLRHNNFGATLGGPIFRDRTFFFASYEGLRMMQPGTISTLVPTMSLRESVPPALRPLLDAFPIPNGPELDANRAEFRAVYSDPRTMDALAIRIDHKLTKDLKIFGRYNHAPSRLKVRSSGSLSSSTVRTVSFSTDTFTFGATQVLGDSSVNDLRVNYSRSESFTDTNLDDFGGAVRPPDSLLFAPPHASPETSAFSFRVDTSTFSISAGGRKQTQLNIVDNFSINAGAHQLRFGFDYRRLTPVISGSKYGVAITTNSSLIQRSMASTVNVSARLGDVFPIFNNFSAYAQDIWSANRRLTLTYGARWDVSPPPDEKNGNFPYTTVGGFDPDDMTLAPKGDPFWKSRYTNIAPRVGAAYLISRSPGRETVARAGFGVFYDLALGTASAAMSPAGFPYSGTKTLRNVAIPLTDVLAAPPQFNLNPPYTEIWVYDRDMKTPRTYQWSAGVDQQLGAGNKISASYVGSLGRNLVSDRFFVDPTPDFFRLHVVRDTGKSEYRSLQLQFKTAAPKSGMAAIVSYTLSRSMDTSSTDSSFGNTADPELVMLDWGPSDFDIRHNLTAGITYDFPRLPKLGPLSPILNGWTMSSMFTARSAAPIFYIEAYTTVWETEFIGFVSCDQFPNTTCPRPDLVPGVPVYLRGSEYPGGKRLNPAAFTTPPPGRQGTLGRNALRGFPLFQVDLSLRRSFKLSERAELQLTAEAFNVFNHPNFADPNGFFFNDPLFDSLFFGIAGQMLGSTRSSVGSGGEAGLNPIYQSGTPRSVQLSARLRF